jgi:hypothetical protein
METARSGAGRFGYVVKRSSYLPSKQWSQSMSITRGRATIADPQDYWDEIVIEDYNAFMSEQDSFRHAFHCAVSLFHMHDWVYVTHKGAIDVMFQFTDRKHNVTKPVQDEVQFANALGDMHPDFELIRQVATTAKHLARTKSQSPHPSAPTHAANTGVQNIGGYFSPSYFSPRYFGSYFGNRRRVMIEPNIDFADKATSVFQMWVSLKQKHSW